MYDWFRSLCELQRLGCGAWNGLISGIHSIILTVVLTRMYALVNTPCLAPRYELGVLALGFHLWRGWSSAMLAMDVVRLPFPTHLITRFALFVRQGVPTPPLGTVLGLLIAWEKNKALPLAIIYAFRILIGSLRTSDQSELATNHDFRASLCR